MGNEGRAKPVNAAGSPAQTGMKDSQGTQVLQNPQPYPFALYRWFLYFGLHEAAGNPSRESPYL